MRFLSGLDLNLIVSLDALLRTRGVTTASRVMFVSQPSMSASLQRLREHFGDELLVKSGRKMVLTPLARALVEPVSSLLHQMEEVLTPPSKFEASSCHATITVASSDHHLRSIITEVSQHLEQHAPHVRLRVIQTTSSAPEVLLQEEIDFVISPRSVISPELQTVLLLTDEYVCIAWKKAKFPDGLTEDEFLSRGHVAAHYGNSPGSEQRALDRLGVKRRVEMVLSSPSLIAPAIIGTQRIAVVPRRLANAQSSYLPIRQLPLPVNLPPLLISLGWHRLRDAVPHLVWFKQLMLKIAKNQT